MRREPLDNRRLADTGLTDQHHRARALAMRQHLEHLLNLTVTAEDRQEAILTRQQVQVDGKVLQEGRQLESLLQSFLAHFHVPHTRRDFRDEHFRVHSMLAHDGHRNALSVCENRHEQIRRLNRLPPHPAGVMKRELEHEIRRR
jgi:hypothetical protein